MSMRQILMAGPVTNDLLRPRSITGLPSAEVPAMRRSILLTLAACAASMLAAPVVEARDHRKGLTVRVPARSFLDPGRVVPVGSLRGYVIGPQFLASPPYASMGSRFGEGTLPDRIGSGANPFGRF
jgi:hypothetical protein